MNYRFLQVAAHPEIRHLKEAVIHPPDLEHQAMEIHLDVCKAWKMSSSWMPYNQLLTTIVPDSPQKQ
jgi:hypothetical protein